MLGPTRSLPLGPLAVCAATCALIGLFTGVVSGVSSAGIAGSIVWAASGAIGAALLGVVLYHATILALVCARALGPMAFVAALAVGTIVAWLGNGF